MGKVDNPISAKYYDYLKLLRVLCDTYDNGNEIVALSISAAIRVLVHDTPKSTSLLKHLDKKGMSFLSTNVKEENKSVHLGLVRRIHVGVHDGIGGEAKYWPLCDERYFPTPKEVAFLAFDEWWGNEHIFDAGESYLTRRDLILSVANKDGGAHFDSAVEKKYDDFRHSWSGRSTLVGTRSGVVRGYDNIPVYPAVRQIGYELMSTLASREQSKDG